MQNFNKLQIKRYWQLWVVSLLLGLVLTACNDNNSSQTLPAPPNPTNSRAFAAYFGVDRLVALSSIRVATNLTATANPPTPTLVPSSPTNGSLAVAVGTLNGRATPTTAAAPSPTLAINPTQAATTPSVASATPLVVSTKAEVRNLLNPLWQTYKARYIQDDGRVKDPQRTDATTSEGQSYALLRALWMDDRAVFDTVLNWSISNLQLPRGDKLFAYLWGKSSDDSWKILDQSVATDADQDIAFALILASQKWNDTRYSGLAQQILTDLWTKTVVNIGGKFYLTAGDWAALTARPVLNPSYFAPYAFRSFAQIDPDKDHNWLALVDSSYEVIKGCTESKLDTAVGKLPPNWCAIDRQTSQFFPALTPTRSTLDTDFGYDAFRIVWRVGLDYRWYGEPRALSYLQSLNLLRDEYKNRQRLAAVYDHAGQVKENSEDSGITAGIGVPLFLAIDPALADQLVTTKLLPIARDVNNGGDPANGDSSKARTYYSQNWTWFGLAYYAEALPKPN